MDPISLFMIAVLGLLIFFMLRNSRKQRRTQQELIEKVRPGAEVMTSFGLYATVIDLNDDTNVATLDVGKGVTIKVHRQTLTKVIEDEPVEETPAKSAAKKADES